VNAISWNWSMNCWHPKTSKKTIEHFCGPCFVGDPNCSCHESISASPLCRPLQSRHFTFGRPRFLAHYHFLFR
jgi:hypothetical protein